MGRPVPGSGPAPFDRTVAALEHLLLYVHPVRRLLDGGRTRMELLGAYPNIASGPPAYADEARRHSHRPCRRRFTLPSDIKVLR